MIKPYEKSHCLSVLRLFIVIVIHDRFVFKHIFQNVIYVWLLGLDEFYAFEFHNIHTEVKGQP